MKIGKGDIRAQRRRRKARYRGCAVCGEPNATLCADCFAVRAVLAVHWAPSLALFVDGGFLPSGPDARDVPRTRRSRYAPLRERIGQEHPEWNSDRVEASLVEALTGAAPRNLGPGHGGAGLVLATTGGHILASRSCAFPADKSSDAELQAVVRGARWAPGAVIYTDSESTCWTAIAANKNLDVRFLREDARGPLHALAHQLSVEGRQRQAFRVANLDDSSISQAR